MNIAMKTELELETNKLAINGGKPVRTHPWPNRGLIGQEEKRAAMKLFDEAIRSGIGIGYNGPNEEAYCQEMAEPFGGGFIDAVNSGTSAVYAGLCALNPPPESEIIVGAMTDPGGIMPVAMLNCIPVSADTAPGSFNTGPAEIAEKITDKTSAIIVAHIGGEPADMPGILEIARKHGVLVLEDCAQAHGARLRGKPLGTFGDIAAFSTMFGKHICTGGQGGFVFTKNEDLYWRTRSAADRGKPFNLPAGSTNPFPSLNLNLDELSAAIGREQIKKLPGIVASRRRIVASLTERMKLLKLIKIPELLSGAESSYWFWRLAVHADRVICSAVEFGRALVAEGIAVNPEYRHIPQTMDWFSNDTRYSCSKGSPVKFSDYPNADAAIDNHFLLQVHECWEEQEIDDTIRAMEKVETAYLKS